jgi:hypothetical protein
MKVQSATGKIFYIFRGKTKTGKDKYFASRSDTSDSGELIDQLPDDFEVHQSMANGSVVVRKRVVSNIRDSERMWVQDRVNRQASVRTKVEIVKNCLVLYTMEWGRGTAMMRFKLIDKDKRIFAVSRYCFRGSVDRWIDLDSEGTLETVCNKFLHHLGEESFYDLI